MTKHSIDLHISLHHGKPKGFKCRFCDHVCAARSGLKIHERNHPESETYRKKINLSKELGYKRKAPKKNTFPVASVNDNRFKCPDCCVVAKSKYVLTMHMNSHPKDGEPGEKCEYCGGIFKKQNFKHHLACNHTNPLLSCKYCDYQTRIRCDFKNHEKNHIGFGEGDFTCEVCESKPKFPTFSNQKYHMKLHHGKDIGFKCDICGYKGRSVNHINKHKKIHDGSNDCKMLPCRYCPASFNTPAGRSRHEQSNHGAGKVIYNCDKCKFTTPAKCHFEEHMRIHENTEGDFECDICQAIFKSKYSRTVHIKNWH